MNLDLFAFLSPIIGVFVCFLLERFLLKDKNVVTNRIRTFLGIETLNLILSIILSAVFLIPLVFLLAPLQIFSFSNLEVPKVLSFILSFLFMDFISYLQHRLHHKIPTLWKFHRLHHSDKHMDSLTTFLHHPLEIVSGFVFTISFAVIFDVPVIVMVIYSLIAGLHSPFTHLRKTIPLKIEKYLKYILITPNFHKVHHSIDMKEGNSNFGIIFIFWDIVFGSSCLKTPSDLNKVELGIDNKQHTDTINLITFIKNPFV